MTAHAILKPGTIGYTIGTRSRRVFDFANPDPSMFDIEDVAWGLAKEGRYANQLRDEIEYRVGQHSCLVADNVPKEHRIPALFHDGPEYVIGDMCSPLKMLCPDYKRVERKVWAAMAQWIGISEQLDPCIKVADNRALHTEKLAFAPKIEGREDWGLDDFPPFTQGGGIVNGVLECWSARRCHDEFMDRFNTWVKWP